MAGKVLQAGAHGLIARRQSRAQLQHDQRHRAMATQGLDHEAYRNTLSRDLVLGAVTGGTGPLRSLRSPTKARGGTQAVHAKARVLSSLAVEPGKVAADRRVTAAILNPKYIDFSTRCQR